MTVFRPCLGCTERTDCTIRKGAVAALKGQSVTTARIRCDLPFTEHFPPGTRVSVKVWDHEDWLGDDTPAKWVSATVVGPSTKKRDKLLLNLDQKIWLTETDSTVFSTAYPRAVKKLDEPQRETCSYCGRALVNDSCGCSFQEDRCP